MLSLPPKIQANIRAWLASLIPTRKMTLTNINAQPMSFAAAMDVDRLHAMIESAKTGDPRDLFALYRDIIMSDSHMLAEFGKRKLAVLGDPLSVQASNKKNPANVVAASACELMIQSCGNWIYGCAHLLDGTLWPVAVVEKVFKPSSIPGLAYELAELVPVPEYLLDYTRQGVLHIRATDNLGFPTGELMEVDPNRYIVHRGHLMSTPDCWGGPMRSLLFWWLFSTMNRDWWARFLDRFGAPFLLGKYEDGDDESRSVLERAFQWATKIGGLVVSKETEVELMQAASQQTGEAYEKFLQICNEEKSKLIIGQTLSANAKATGMGSGVAKEQGNVRDDIRAFDALMLGDTFTRNLCSQFLRINHLSGAAPKLVWGGQTADESEKTGNLLASLAQAGLEPTDDAMVTLGEKLGFPLQRRALPVGGGMPSSLAALSPDEIITLAARAGTLNPYAIKREAALTAIAEKGAAPLSQTFRKGFAPVRRMILDSESPHDLREKLSTWLPDWDPVEAAKLIEDGLVACAANGTLLKDGK